LWQLDRSVLAASSVRVAGPPETIALLAGNEPWQQMAREGFIRLDPLSPDEPVALTARVSATPIRVPHRSEWRTDTVAYRIDGPTRSTLYLPDIDRWDEWEVDIAEVVADIDIALLDATFWEPFPMPGVPHPPVTETLDRLQPIADARRTTILFTHLNHTNPLVDPDSRESHEVYERGFRVAREGDVFAV
jgi:pyrroloquinoline quinone biosynthesis protein B